MVEMELSSGLVYQMPARRSPTIDIHTQVIWLLVIWLQLGFVSYFRSMVHPMKKLSDTIHGLFRSSMKMTYHYFREDTGEQSVKASSTNYNSLLSGIRTEKAIFWDPGVVLSDLAIQNLITNLYPRLVHNG